MGLSVVRGMAAVCLLAIVGNVFAFPVTPEDGFKALIRVDTDIKPLGKNPFGEIVDTYTGALTFRQTDVHLVGTGLPLELIRRRNIGDDDLTVGALADWHLELPHIESLSADVNAFDPAIHTVPPNSPHWYFLDDPARCSNFSPPKDIAILSESGRSAPMVYAPNRWWHGYKLTIPGLGDQDLLQRDASNTLAPQMSQPSGAAYAFNLVTTGHWQVACLPQTSNGAPGEGFLVVSPQGVKYWMDWLATVSAAPGGYGSIGYAQLSRRMVLMLASRVQDRFGNTLTYAYDSNGNLLSIQASDGRQLTLVYQGGATQGNGSPTLSSVTLQPAATSPRTWRYTYSQSNLTSATLPDGSSWTFNLAQWNQMTSFQNVQWSHAGQPCTFTINEGPWPITTGTIGAPSGLQGSFSTQVMARGRSYVPYTCDSVGSGDGTFHIEIPSVFPLEAIVSKTYSGAGISPQTWSYSYSPRNDSFSKDCASGCPSTVWMDIVDPSSNRTRYTLSNKFDYTEGKLLETDYFSGTSSATPLQSQFLGYASPSTGPWPVHFGASHQDYINPAQLEQVAPQNQTVVFQDGDTYANQVSAFNIFVQPTQVSRFNSIAGQSALNETTSYLNDSSLWVLGLTTQVVNTDDGLIETANTYTAQDQLSTRAAFGQVLMSYGFDTLGQLASFTDGNNHATSLSAYHRGIPQNIVYPDGKSASAVVDDFGQIGSFTDQRGATTNYQYDAAGRVTQVSHNSFSGDPAWLPQTYTYTFVTFAEEGLPAGHWRRSIDQGLSVKADWFDALMRPVLTDTGIMGSGGGVNISKVTGYDWQGKVIFSSTPVNGIPDVTTITTGTHIQYDALERVAQSQQDSELGTLTTTTVYLPGDSKQVTDPKGNVTTFNYQAFDQPSYDTVTQLHAPEGVTQVVARDHYGKPTSITQSGSFNGQALSVAKTFVYDANQRLCRFTDPETNSTVYSYDGANNIAWKAMGQVISGGGCGQEQVADGNKTVNTYDPLDRLLTETSPAGTQSTTYTYDAAGELLDARSGSNHWFSSYDSLGHIQGEAYQVDGQAAASGVGYTYDTYGHVLSANYFPGGGVAPEIVTYAPDALGRPTQAGSYATNISYQPDGSMAAYTLGNGIRVSFGENTRLLPASRSAVGSGGTAMNELYNYDANGNLVSVNDIGGNGNGQTLGYDGLNRLVSGSAPGPWGVQVYAYDPLNNLRENTNSGTVVNYNIDGSNHVVAETVNGNPFQSFGYDARGNRSAVVTNGVSTAYNFDALNQLLSISGKANYLYDDVGRRVAKVLANGQISYSFYSRTNGHLLAASDTLTGLTTNYIYLNDQLIARHQGSAVTYLVTDRLGTPIVEANASGTTTQRFAYDPYGGRRQGPIQQQPGFTGHVNDPESGLTYMQARYYDPNGHMTGPDPSYPTPGDIFGFNRYDYADNNPVMRIDPNGRNSIVVYNPDGTINIQVPVNFTGPAANGANISAIKSDVATRWTGLYNVNGEITKVSVAITDVTADTPKQAINNVTLLDGPTSNKAGQGASFVGNDHVSGEWNMASGGMKVGEAAHETGHLMGDIDYYKNGTDADGNRITTASEGYTNNLMGALNHSVITDSRNMSVILSSPINVVKKPPPPSPPPPPPPPTPPPTNG